MCGIGAFVDLDQAPRGSADMRRMMARVAHRGPDDEGFLGYVATADGWRPTSDGHAPVWLGHRRLSIIDLSSEASQPMIADDGQLALSFNGEIYNYVELREELERLGVVFRTSSDSEVLLRAYAAWGASCMTRLRGMFALLIVDAARGELFVGRDPFGIKPLYFVQTDSALIFGSECKMLVDHTRRGANVGVVHDYLYRGRTDIGASTFFDEIQSFPPAHYAIVELRTPSRVAPVRYWSPGGPRFEGSLGVASEQFRELLSDSVRIHLRSDVPLGASISGGLDSSSIVNLAARWLPHGSEVELFTYSATDRIVNEDRWVELANEAIGWRIHRVNFGWGDLWESLDALVYAQDYPFGTLSMYAENQVFRAARARGIKVMLGGQGADEYLAGYPPYVAARLASHVRRGELLRALALLRGARRTRGVGVSSTLLRSLSYFAPTVAQDALRRMVGRPVFPEWMDGGWFELRGVHGVAPHSFTSSSVLLEELTTDVTETGIPHHLRSEDRSAMQYSIENRVPFLEPGLVDFVLSLPEEFLISPQGESKRVLRHAMRGVIPPGISERQDKIGYEAGSDWWTMIGDKLSKELAVVGQVLPFIRQAGVDRLVEQLNAGDSRHLNTVWRIVNLARWSRCFAVQY